MEGKSKEIAEVAVALCNLQDYFDEDAQPALIDHIKDVRGKAEQLYEALNCFGSGALSALANTLESLIIGADLALKTYDGSSGKLTHAEQVFLTFFESGSPWRKVLPNGRTDVKNAALGQPQAVR